jgi:hypothetical protein
MASPAITTSGYSHGDTPSFPDIDEVVEDGQARTLETVPEQQQQHDATPPPTAHEAKVAAAAAAHKLVTFEPNDPENPKNWSRAYKWYCTMVVALTCFVVAFASSVITADIPGVVQEFGVSEELALVSISIFVVGFGVGPMAFAPLSEVLGRRII